MDYICTELDTLRDRVYYASYVSYVTVAKGGGSKLNEDELSIAQASEALGVTHTAVLDMIKDGRLTIAREAQRGQRRRVWVSSQSVEEERQRREGRPRESTQ